MDKPVAVLGCGPAGLFAAQGIRNASGVAPLIFSKKIKSQIYGAQYLQRPVPGLSSQDPDGWIKTVLLGNKGSYAERVYGDRGVATSWPDIPPEPTPAWDLRKTYDRAWAQWDPFIVDFELDYNEVCDMTARFPLVISTIPAHALCAGYHQFHSMPIAVRHVFLEGLTRTLDNCVVYNGTDYGHWYRSAYIFGKGSTEYNPVNMSDEEKQGMYKGFKVLGNNCDCHPNLVRAGRMGTWARGVLTHQAHDAAAAAYHEVRLAI